MTIQIQITAADFAAANIGAAMEGKDLLTVLTGQDPSPVSASPEAPTPQDAEYWDPEKNPTLYS